MQGCTYEKSYKKINIKKNKFNLYKIKKKSQMNHTHSISFKNNHNLIKT